MDLRQADADDADALHSLLLATFAPLRGQYTDGGYTGTVHDPATLARRLPEGPCWVVEGAGGRGGLVGTVSAVLRPDGVYLRSLAVHPDARGDGLGERLMRVVETFARDAGAPRVYLSTTPFLHAAIRLYEREGYVRTDAGPHELGGTPLVTYEKRLA